MACALLNADGKSHRCKLRAMADQRWREALARLELCHRRLDDEKRKRLLAQLPECILGSVLVLQERFTEGDDDEDHFELFAQEAELIRKAVEKNTIADCQLVKFTSWEELTGTDDGPLTKFVSKMKPGETYMIYYIGHGMETNNCTQLGELDPKVHIGGIMEYLDGTVKGCNVIFCVNTCRMPPQDGEQLGNDDGKQLGNDHGWLGLA